MTERVALAIAFTFALMLIFAGTGTLPLLDPDEGRNAQVAREMAASGHWAVPTYAGLPYLDKPALYFGMVALSFRVLGISETTARLPSGVFAVALLLLVYGFCRSEYGVRTAILAVVVVASMPMFFAFSRLVIFDMPLAFFVSAAIVAGYHAEKSEGRARRRWYLLGAAAAGLATLIKGPIGIILPTLVLFSSAVMDRRSGVVRRLLAPGNLAVFAAFVVPWVVAVSLQRPDFLRYGLLNETLSRFATPAFARTQPFFYYGPVLAASCYGWSLLLPESALIAWRRRTAWQRADRLLVVWTITVVAFFSLSQSKLPGYVLTAVVALGVLVARLFDRAIENPEGAAARVVLRGATMAAMSSLALGVWLALEMLAPGYLTSMFHITGRAYQRARPIFPTIFAIIAISGLAVAAARVSRRVWSVFAAFVVFPAAVLTIGFDGMRQYAEDASASQLAARVEELAPTATVACVQCYPPGLPFYLDRPVALISDDGSETTSNYIPYYLAQLDSWPAPMIPFERRHEWLRERDGAVLLLGRPEVQVTMDELVGTANRTEGELPGGWRYVLFIEPTSS